MKTASIYSDKRDLGGTETKSGMTGEGEIQESELVVEQPAGIP